MTVPLKLMKSGSYKCCSTIELIQVKELMLLKVITVKHVQFSTIFILIMGSNFKILCVMVAMT